MSNTTGTGHDTGLYDPNVHDNQIVAMYETDADARSAMAALTAAGIPASAAQVVARGTSTGGTGMTGATEDTGMWGSIKSLFVPDDDKSAYTHAVGRGHAMLVVTPTGGMDRNKIIHTLEGTNPVDFDARLEEWRQTGYDTTAVHQDYATATGYVAPAATAAVGAATTLKDNEKLQVVEESLRVGKREVAGGAVRIRSYVVERPVEEQVSLHEEHITVDRHAVNRPANPADMAAFQERTIEARATSEQAVVGKEARVVEEIGLNKSATERVETVRDTVRKTEVEVIDDTVTTGGRTSVSGTTGTTTGPVSTPGATTSGTNTPRR